MNFEKHLEKYLSKEEIDSLMYALNMPSKHAALLNNRKMDDETFKKLFPNVIPHPFVKHAYIYDKNEYDLGKSIYHLLGCFYLQEPSAMMPSFLLNPSEDDILLDLCAAPGGKSIQASFLMNNKGLIISNDIARNRCDAILENVERLGIGNIIITNNDFDLIKNNYKNTFTKIILDAPCSGSGMFRKENKMKDDWSFNKVLKYAETQKQLILMAYDMLTDGGDMVYSTCSFSFEEDEEVIQYLLENTNAELIDIPDNEMLYKSNNLPLGVHLLPNLFPGEGHYICLIHKPGLIKKHPLKEKETSNKFKGVDIDQKLTYVQRFGDTLFALPHPPINIKPLHIVRMGVKIGEYIKDIFKYSYHYSHYIDSFANEIKLNDEQLEQYLKGQVLYQQSTRGYVLLIYKGVNLSFGKSDGKVIKNHFPKGLRR